MQAEHCRSSTKATLHLDLTKATWLPETVIRKIKEKSHHVTTSDSIVLQCDEHRKQSENTEKCFDLLYRDIKWCVGSDLPGETSPEKHKHVMDLQKAERESRKRIKVFHKAKKDARRGRGGSGLD